MDRLTLLVNDRATLDQLKEYLFGYLQTRVLENVFAKKEITGYAEASEILKDGLQKMEMEFSKKEDKQPLNESL